MLVTYDPKEIIVSVAGQILSGFADERVAVEREDDQVKDEVGSDGEVARWLTNDRRGTITLQLMPGSTSNLFLSTLANADELNGNQVFPVSVKDNRGLDLHVAAEAWIQKQPRAMYRKGIESRTWVLRCADLRMVVGGAPAA